MLLNLVGSTKISGVKLLGLWSASLRASLVNVNTGIVQSILNDPGWADRLSSEDMRGLSALFFMYINPCGRFELDLDERIDFLGRAA